MNPLDVVRRATNRVSRIYHIVLLAVWVVLVPGFQVLIYPAFHAVMLVWGLPSLRRQRATWARLLPERARSVLICLLGFLVLSVCWNELGVLHRIWPRSDHDVLVEGWEQTLFASNLSSSWSLAMPAGWFSELMHGFYAGYYLLAFLPLIIAGFFRSEAEATEARFRLLMTYLLVFLVYLFFPVMGPAAVHPVLATPGGFFTTLTGGLRTHGDSLGTAFPSSHVAGSVAMAIGVWRWWGWGWGVVWLSGAMLVALATVYTGNHLVIDVVAGAMMGGVLQWNAARGVFLPRDLGQRAPGHVAYSSSSL